MYHIMQFGSDSLAKMTEEIVKGCKMFEKEGFRGGKIKF